MVPLAAIRSVALTPSRQRTADRSRSQRTLIGAGDGVHWPELDEDISIEALLAGRRSLESEKSFQTWLDRRPKTRPDHEIPIS